MRIGHYPSGIGEQGGRASYIRRVGEAQQASGHDIVYFDEVHPALRAHEVVCVPDDATLFAEAAARDLDILHLHTTVEVPDDVPVPTLRSLHTHRPYCPSGTRYLARTATPCDRAYHPAGCLWGHWVDRCGPARPSAVQSNFARMKREWRALRRIPVVTVSAFQKDEMVRAGFSAASIRSLLSPGPDPTRYEPPPREGVPRFLFLGRVVPEKGIDWLLRAIAQVDVSVHLDVAGTGRADTSARALAETLGITDRVTFHGWCDKERIEALLEAARALIFPSVWHEPAGLVSVEAAAHGRAVIASRVGGIPEYARPEFSLLVEPHNVDGLAHSITRLAMNYDEARRMGRCGQDTIRERFLMQDYVEQLEAIYQDVRAAFVPGTRSVPSST